MSATDARIDACGARGHPRWHELHLSVAGCAMGVTRDEVDSHEENMGVTRRSCTGGEESPLVPPDVHLVRIPVELATLGLRTASLAAHASAS
jgi:hypothetical protein